jgi:hypothetical protein
MVSLFRVIAPRRLRTLLVRIDLHQLHKACVVVRLRPLCMRYPHTCGDTDAIDAPARAKGVSVTVVGTILLRVGVGRTAEHLREETGKAQSHRRHASTDDADLGLDERP